MSPSKKRLDLIVHELRVHLPFTIIGVLASMIFLAVIQMLFIRSSDLNSHTLLEKFFHLFHYIHIFFSAMTASAIFFRHERHVIKTITIGYLSTLSFCAISDSLLPFIGGFLLSSRMELHICLLKHPLWVLLANGLGIWVGMLGEIKQGKISYISHGAHIFISSLASLFYLVSFGVPDWSHLLFGVFLVTTFAVVIPCCSSDIILPLSFLRLGALHGHEHEDEHTK